MAKTRDPLIGRWLGQLSLLCANKPKQTVILIVAATFIVGLGMTQLETDSDLLKILPKDHPNTIAAQNAAIEFDGFYNFVTFFYAVDDDKCQHATDEQLPNRRLIYDESGAEITCENILHEAYVRGMDEVWMFMQEEVPSAEYAIDFAQLIKVVNWTNDGYGGDNPDQAVIVPAVEGDPDRIGRPTDLDAFSMPGTDEAGAGRYYSAFQGVLAIDEAARDTVAPTLTAGRTLIFFNPAENESRVDLGNQVYAAVDAYQAAMEACDDTDPSTICTLNWNVFSSTEGVAVRGVATIDAHSSEVTQRDISVLAPIIIWAIILILYLAFRDVRVILVAAANLLAAFIWTAGLMGWMHIPFSALNMTIVPLILGVGIDYGIHMVSEYMEHKADRMGNRQAFKEAGKRAGIAMAIATVTTASGLLMMVLSPSILMGQLGIVSAIALVVTFAFTMTLIPAVLTLTARDRLRAKPHGGSRWIPAMANGIGRARWLTLVVVLVISGGALANIGNLEKEAFGDPERNFPPGDRVRDDSDWIAENFFGATEAIQTNYFIVQGDFTDPELHTFLDTLTTNLENDADIQGFNTAALPRIVRGWVAVDQGTPDAVAQQGLSNSPEEAGQRDAQYPKTQEEMKQTLDEMFASPMANFATILVNQEYTMGLVAFDQYQSETTFEASEEVWLAAERVVQQTRKETGLSEADVDVRLFGNNAFSYLFITEEQPWVNTIGYVSFGTVVVLIALLTRNLRATLCTATLMGVTALWWLGLLPLMGIGLSVGLMLPLVFIMAIGSDDAVHLIWNMELTPDRRKVYRFVGQAVLLTSITTFVAFGIFSRQTDLLVTRTLLATTAAVVVMWVATMLIVPIFYPPHGSVVESPIAESPGADEA
jgi:predicted RND superfamily exporter protein